MLGSIRVSTNATSSMKKPMLQSGLLLTAAWILYFCSTDHSLGSRNLSLKSFGADVLDMESSCPSHNLPGRR